MHSFTTALIVADNPSLEAELTAMLHQRGLTITCAPTSTAGLTVWTQQQQTLVIIATSTDSAELNRTIRTQSTAACIIAVGDGSPAALLSALRARIDDYLILPIDRAEFDRMLDDQSARMSLNAVAVDQAFVEQVQIQSLALMSRLAANLAHEINNPLTPILGLAEMLRDEAGPDSATAAISGTIIASARRIATTTQSLMGFTRPLARRDIVDLRDLIGETLQSMALTLAEQHINVHLDFPDTAVSLAASVAELKQALFILIDHARQSMPDGGTLSIAIATERNADGALCARIDISDSAAPIPEYHLPNLFAPFYSHGNPSVSAGPGLAVARWVAVIHGGWVSVEVNATIGNTFHLTLAL